MEIENIQIGTFTVKDMLESIESAGRYAQTREAGYENMMREINNYLGELE